MAAPLGFKTFATGDVLTAADTNGYLMQGIWVFANSTARDAAVTSPQEGNSCYLKDTDVIQVYSGSAWVTKSGGSPLTTKGDVYTYSTTDARLAVGANDTVLTADSTAATGLKWATPASGGMTLISTTTLTGASVTLSSIPSTYNYLYVVIRAYLPATDGTTMSFRFNADATASRHATLETIGQSAISTFNATSIVLTAAADNAVTQGFSVLQFWDYANTTTWKSADVFSFNNDETTSTSWRSIWRKGLYNQTGAISSLSFFTSGGNFTSGSILLYGVK